MSSPHISDRRQEQDFRPNWDQTPSSERTDHNTGEIPLLFSRSVRVL